jgi:hypothetical protein
MRKHPKALKLPTQPQNIINTFQLYLHISHTSDAFNKSRLNSLPTFTPLTPLPLTTFLLSNNSHSLNNSSLICQTLSLSFIPGISHLLLSTTLAVVCFSRSSASPHLFVELASSSALAKDANEVEAPADILNSPFKQVAEATLPEGFSNLFNPEPTTTAHTQRPKASGTLVTSHPLATLPQEPKDYSNLTTVGIPDIKDYPLVNDTNYHKFKGQIGDFLLEEGFLA